MRYLSAQELLVLHALVVDETGGSHGVRDVGLLQSVAAKPAARFGGKDLYKGAFSKAAVLLEALINYHVFVDGNKRTGLIASARFLAINGYTLTASNKKLEALALAVATKEVEVKEITARLKKYSKRG
jgi:death-on-curing protein